MHPCLKLKAIFPQTDWQTLVGMTQCCVTHPDTFKWDMQNCSSEWRRRSTNRNEHCGNNRVRFFLVCATCLESPIHRQEATGGSVNKLWTRCNSCSSEASGTFELWTWQCTRPLYEIFSTALCHLFLSPWAVSTVVCRCLFVFFCFTQTGRLTRSLIRTVLGDALPKEIQCVGRYSHTASWSSVVLS